MIDMTRVIVEEASRHKNTDRTGRTVVYWMNRDQRAEDNWALIHAYDEAKRNNKNFTVVFKYQIDSRIYTRRQLAFSVGGLMEAEKKLRTLNIPFHVICGKDYRCLADYFKAVDGCLLVTDFSPLREDRLDRASLAEALDTEIHTVDAHNIVPCHIVSDKEEYAARTIRPKISRLLDFYLTDFPDIKAFEQKDQGLEWAHTIRAGLEEGQASMPYAFDQDRVDWTQVERCLSIDEKVAEIDWIMPGAEAGKKVFKDFIENKLHKYNDLRNDPNADAQSNLSPYFHFGQIAPQRVAYEIRCCVEPSDNTASFLEEMIVRRELTDNYCFYNGKYDSLDGVKDWAKTTLYAHADDVRMPLYDKKELEEGRTDETLWNAAQMELVKRGKLHGYMRMYWAKKILEWTKSPEEAFSIALELNDKYSIDGNDPNGFVGVAWSIGGIHDRAWKERLIFGKIRYMNKNGCARKFDVQKYIETHLGG